MCVVNYDNSQISIMEIDSSHRAEIYEVRDSIKELILTFRLMTYKFIVRNIYFNLTPRLF